MTTLENCTIETTRQFRVRRDGAFHLVREVFEGRCTIKYGRLDRRVVCVTLVRDQGIEPQPMWVLLSALPSNLRDILVAGCKDGQPRSLPLALRWPDDAGRRLVFLGLWSQEEERCTPFFTDEAGAVRSEAA